MYGVINKDRAGIGALSFDAFDPRSVMKMSLDVMRLAAESLRLFVPGPGKGVVWQEFNNKLQAFSLFENADSVLRLEAGKDVPLAKLIQKTRLMGAYRAVWVTEGLGHYQTETCWARSREPKKLLNNSSADDLPTESLTPLHAGMGLSIANRLLKTIRSPNSQSEIRGVLERFIELCRHNSRSGYLGVSYEALGLAARNLYPHLVRIIDQQLQQIDAKLVGYFWHGVGRAIYFAPTNFLPFNNSPWRAIRMAQREPIHEIGRLNALAGVVWALTLINIQQPEILENLLSRHRKELSGSDALTNGVSSAIMIWRDSTADDSGLEGLCRHQPESSDRDLVRLWTEQILQPCRIAVQRFYPVIREHDCLGEIFRYQSLTKLVSKLEKERGH
jgi:hypothetical protein